MNHTSTTQIGGFTATGVFDMLRTFGHEAWAQAARIVEQSNSIQSTAVRLQADHIKEAANADAALSMNQVVAGVGQIVGGGTGVVFSGLSMQQNAAAAKDSLASSRLTYAGEVQAPAGGVAGPAAAVIAGAVEGRLPATPVAADTTSANLQTYARSGPVSYETPNAQRANGAERNAAIRELDAAAQKYKGTAEGYQGLAQALPQLISGIGSTTQSALDIEDKRRKGDHEANSQLAGSVAQMAGSSTEAARGLMQAAQGLAQSSNENLANSLAALNRTV
jgi:hypothetical protein